MTGKQKLALDFIRERIERTGVTPSYSEIATGIGIKNRGGAHTIVRHLIEAGHLVHRDNRVRSLALPSVDLSAVPTFALEAELRRRA